MTLLGNMIQSACLSYSNASTPAGTVVMDYTPPLLGVYRIELHMYDSPPSCVAIAVGPDTVFTPASTAAPGGAPYTFQVVADPTRHIQMKSLVACTIYADMIITQIG